MARKKPKKSVQGRVEKIVDEKVSDHVEEHVEDIKEELEEHVEDIKEDIEEHVEDIKEDIKETGKEIDELKEDIEEIQKIHKSMFQKISDKFLHSEFNPNDVAQQIVGAIILSSPLAVTSEVWQLASILDTTRVMIILGITLLFDVLLIYFTGYRKNGEKLLANFLPARLFSMLLVSYSVAAIMLYVFGVIGYRVTEEITIIKLIIFVGLFTNIGAGTADLIK